MTNSFENWSIALEKVWNLETEEIVRRNLNN